MPIGKILIIIWISGILIIEIICIFLYSIHTDLVDIIEIICIILIVICIVEIEIVVHSSRRDWLVYSGIVCESRRDVNYKNAYGSRRDSYCCLIYKISTRFWVLCQDFMTWGLIFFRGRLTKSASCDRVQAKPTRPRRFMRYYKVYKIYKTL